MPGMSGVGKVTVKVSFGLSFLSPNPGMRVTAVNFEWD